MSQWTPVPDPHYVYNFPGMPHPVSGLVGGVLPHYVGGLLPAVVLLLLAGFVVLSRCLVASL